VIATSTLKDFPVFPRRGHKTGAQTIVTQSSLSQSRISSRDSDAPRGLTESSPGGIVPGAHSGQEG